MNTQQNSKTGNQASLVCKGLFHAASAREEASQRVPGHPLVAYPYVLEEPGAHDVGGMLGQHAPLVLGRAVILVQEAEVLV